MSLFLQRGASITAIITAPVRMTNPPQSGRLRMVSWFALLDSAKTPFEVLGVARDFMATWTPEELARLPEPCRPGKLRDADDIEALHARLVEEYRSTRATGPALKSLQELTSFMVRASIRFAEISDVKGSGGSGGSPSGPTKSASPPEN